VGCVFVPLQVELRLGFCFGFALLLRLASPRLDFDLTDPDPSVSQ
jgi:hypothetical protein